MTCGFDRVRQIAAENSEPNIHAIMNEQSTISRRRVISGLGAGLAAVAAPRVFAAQQNRNL